MFDFPEQTLVYLNNRDNTLLVLNIFFQSRADFPKELLMEIKPVTLKIRQTLFYKLILIKINLTGCRFYQPQLWLICIKTKHYSRTNTFKSRDFSRAEVRRSRCPKDRMWSGSQQNSLCRDQRVWQRKGSFMCGRSAHVRADGLLSHALWLRPDRRSGEKCSSSASNVQSQKPDSKNVKLS